MSKNNKKKKKNKNSNYQNTKSGQNSPNVKKEIEKTQKTDYNIPTISFKSGMILMVSAAIATLVFPYLLSLVGVDFGLGAIIGNVLITSFAVAYTRYFVETKRGFCFGFWRLYVLFAISFAIIGWFWVYKGVYL